MAHNDSAYRLGSEFDSFLFAPISEDGSGMSLSVVSALARLGLDPWAEAAELTKLPGAKAVQRLTSLIESLPRDRSAQASLEPIAARLVSLLPRFGGSGVPHRSTTLDNSFVTNTRPLLYAYAALMVVLLGSQWLLADSRPPPHVASAHAAAADALPSKSPNSGRSQ